jgi:hypothetical protein
MDEDYNVGKPYSVPLHVENSREVFIIIFWTGKPVNICVDVFQQAIHVEFSLLYSGQGKL